MFKNEPSMDVVLAAKFKQTTSLTAMAVFVLGALVLVGWKFDIATLKTILPNYISMKANTAVGLMALASALWLLRSATSTRLQRGFGIAAAVLAFGFGFLTMGEYLFGWNLGIDEIFFADPAGVVGKFPPGRLAPVTALNLMLLSSALLLMNTSKRAPYRFAQLLVLMTLVIAFQAFVAYLCGVTYSFGSAFYTQIAIHTAVGFIALCVGVLASRPTKGLMEIFSADSAGGFLARRLIGTVIVIPPLVNLLQSEGQTAGLYDADFGVLIRVIGNVCFFAVLVWRTSTNLHQSDSKRQQSEALRRELERAETVSAATREAALEASRMKSQFLANMSHEIRTPINGVVGLATLLESTQLSTSQREYVEGIKVASDALLSVINDILDFSKVEAGRMELETTEFDLDALISDIGKSMSFTARQKGLLFKAVSPSQFGFFVCGDQGRLRQVMLNLLSNAIKFTTHGGVDFVVSLSPAAPGATTTATFEIRDTGIGIPAAVIGRLFQPFSQADSSTTRRFGGTGLGLSICKQLVDLMGGELGVSSADGVGSTFHFSVPLTVGSARDVTPRSPMHMSELPQFTGARALVAEDNFINQKVALGMLEKLGVTAIAVGNGLEVIQALTAADYDIVFMDCQMPEMDGYQATEAVRGSLVLRQRDIPIVAMTASAIKGDKERCLAVGMSDYVSKPVKIGELARVLTKWLSKTASDDLSNAPVALVVLDQTYIDDIRSISEGANQNLLVEILSEFLASSPTRVRSMIDAWQRQDVASAVREAHSLKGASANLGASRLAAAIQHIEDLHEAVDATAVAKLFESVERELASASIALEAVLINERQRAA